MAYGLWPMGTAGCLCTPWRTRTRMGLSSNMRVSKYNTGSNSPNNIFYEATLVQTSCASRACKLMDDAASERTEVK
eukprot:8330805-Pyramimonas_sp.AAC.1